MNRRAETGTRDRDRRRSPRDADLAPRREDRRRFADEQWLTPLQIARKLGYETDKPVRNAIKRGELKASHAPCRRKLIVAESEVLRWIDDDLVYEPMTLDSERPPNAAPPLNGRAQRGRQMPTLDYDAGRDEPR